jgi:uncharacterized membrane protein YcfT
MVIAGHTAQASAPRQTTRIAWMDTLRGTAILLLVLWHATSIPTRFGFDMPTWLFLLNEIFLPWRMPALMFLSGLLLAGSLRKTTRVYYVGKVENLLWPYLLWAAVYLALFPGTGESITSPMSWFGAGYLWFILYLFLYYAVAPLVVRAPWWVVLPVLVAGAMFIPHPSPQKICYFAVFFFAGHFGRTLIPKFLSASRTTVAVVALVALGFTGTSLTLSAASGRHFFEFAPLSVPFVLALIAIGVRLAHDVERRAAHARPWRWISWIGRNSVVFYLTHVPLMLIACVVSERLVGDLGLWIVGLCCVAALLGGIPLALANRHASVSWLFRAPRLETFRGRKVRRAAMVGGAG